MTSTLVRDHYKHLEDLSFVELDERRRELTSRGDAISTDELSELVYVLTRLRRKNSGPPKKIAKTSRSIKTKISAEDLA
jgi:hypothetical protein